MRPFPMPPRILPALLFLGAVAALAGPHRPAPSPWAALARGRVEPPGGIIQVAARRPGVVRSIDVHEGDRVTAGEALAALDDDAARLDLTLAEARLTSARAAVGPLEARRQAARREVVRLKRLVGQQLADARDLDRTRDQVAELDAEIAQARAGAGVAQARVALARHEVAARVIRAPVAGRILRRLISPGEAVGAEGTPVLFWLAPDGPLTVVAQLDENTAPLIRTGQQAEVVTDAAKPAVYRATVKRVGVLYGPRRPATDDPTQPVDVRVVNCLLVLDESKPPLLIGQRVIVRFLRPKGAAR